MKAHPIPRKMFEMVFVSICNCSGSAKHAIYVINSNKIHYLHFDFHCRRWRSKLLARTGKVQTRSWNGRLRGHRSAGNPKEIQNLLLVHLLDLRSAVLTASEALTLFVGQHYHRIYRKLEWPEKILIYIKLKGWDQLCRQRKYKFILKGWDQFGWQRKYKSVVNRISEMFGIKQGSERHLVRFE